MDYDSICYNEILKQLKEIKEDVKRIKDYVDEIDNKYIVGDRVG